LLKKSFWGAEQIGGTGTLLVDGKKAAEGHIARTLAFRLSLDETLDRGEDTGTPRLEEGGN
jgi:hypothetical protein